MDILKWKYQCILKLRYPDLFHFLSEAFCRRCVSMGAVGAMAPMNLTKDAIGTHEILNSMYIGTSYLIDWHPWNLLVIIEWHPHFRIPNTPSKALSLR